MSSTFDITGLKEVGFALKQLAKDVDKKKEIEKDLRSASKQTVMSAKSMANQADITVKRYGWKNGRYRKGTKDGQGRVVAAYLPGNLKQSIKVIKTKSPNPLIHIGAKAGGGKRMGNATGVYGAGRSDGWYAHFIHEGTKFNDKKNPFLEKAYSQTKHHLESQIGLFLQRKIKRNAKKLGFETL